MSIAIEITDFHSIRITQTCVRIGIYAVILTQRSPQPCFPISFLFFRELAFLIFIIMFLLFHAYGCFSYMYVCAPLTCLVPVEARRSVLKPLELKLSVIASHHVGAENQTSARISNALNC